MSLALKSRLVEINAGSEADFLRVLGLVFEHSPWVAQAAFKARPFASIQALHQAMMAAVAAAEDDIKITLLRAHPELAGREAREGTMTEASTSEQGRLGLTALSAAEFLSFTALNRAYREKFDFPCIVALRRHQSKESVSAAIKARLGNGRDVEIANALDEIGYITRGRLDALLGG